MGFLVWSLPFDCVPLRILIHFFRNFIWLSLSITFFECALLWSTVKSQFIVSLLLTKLAANILIATYFLFFQGNKLYFYYNLGLTKIELFGSAFVIDMVFWSMAITLTVLFS